jgi:hypothetical protein
VSNERRLGPNEPECRRGPDPVIVNKEVHVYEKPRVERYGTFRELTRAGWDRDSDGLVVFGIGGDNLCGAPNRPECPWDDRSSGRS